MVDGQTAFLNLDEAELQEELNEQEVEEQDPDAEEE